MCTRRAILDVLQSHTKLVSEFLPANVHEREGTISPVEFLSRFVAQSLPLVIRRDADVASWPALAGGALWRDQAYLNEALRDARVTVALTPDGLADAPASDSGAFMLPAESTMPYPDFIEMLRKQDPVVYLQKQNNSFVEEFAALAADIGRIPWADTAFGAANIDAINFWQGAWPTKTSWHRDPYENIYVVVRGTLRLPHVTTSPRSESLRAALTRVRPGPTPPGTKRVRLLPMTDAYRMRIGLYSQSKWEYENGAFTSRQIEGEPVPWSSLAPCTCEAGSRCPSCLHLADHPPKEVILKAGDVLYIPAWVYHEVSHDRPDDDRPDDDASCIAINMWYEAQYGQHGFATIQTFDRLSHLVNTS